MSLLPEAEAELKGNPEVVETEKFEVVGPQTGESDTGAAFAVPKASALTDPSEDRPDTTERVEGQKWESSC